MRVFVCAFKQAKLIPILSCLLKSAVRLYSIRTCSQSKLCSFMGACYGSLVFEQINNEWIMAYHWPTQLQLTFAALSLINLFYIGEAVHLLCISIAIVVSYREIPWASWNGINFIRKINCLFVVVSTPLIFIFLLQSLPFASCRFLLFGSQIMDGEKAFLKSLPN